MAKVKTNFASLTDAQNAATPATESANTKSTGFNFSSLADSDVATPEAQPSKKKVDTVLSGTTSFLDSSFKAKGPLFDSKEELTRLGKIEGALTPEERAQKAEDARQQKIAEDKLANYKRSVIYDAISASADAAYINKGFVAGMADVGASMVGLAGLLSNFRPSGVSTGEYVNRKLAEERAGTQPSEAGSLQEERYGKKASTNIAYEAAAEMSNLSGFLTKEAKKDIGVSDEDLTKGPVDLMLEGNLADGLKVLSVEITKAIPNVIVQSALAPEAGAGFLAQKAATFATTTATALGGNLAQDYAQDKDISSEDILKGVAKSAIEGLTESFFMGDIKALKGIGSSLAKGEGSVAKELLKGVIEKEGKEAAKQEIARGFSKPLAKMLGRGFEGASVVGQFNKGGVEEGIEEVMSTVGSFIVDRVADDKWSDADYMQLVKDASNAFAIGYGSGGMMNGVAANLSMKKLTDEQKAKVEKFNEVASNENLSSEVRNIAKQKADDIIRESADLSYAGYDELTKLPVEKRVQAFSILTDINAQEESKKDVKDVDLISAIDESIKAKQAEYDSILTGKNVEATQAAKEKPATEEQIKAPEVSKTEQEAYQEELAKADASFKVTMGIPTEPMKVSPDFSLRVKPDEIGINNAYEPSPNMPLEVVAGKGKKVQFSTKQNPDALLEGDVYTVNQGNKKFATILSTQRNGVQEYYVPELDDAKGYANLEDAKFAVQEKLTGVRVDEITRSGIDRLRADMAMPKANIPIVTDNGQEVLLDPVAKKSIGNAVKAFKTVSNAPVYLYKNTEDFKKGLAKELGNDEDAIGKAGAVGGGFFTNERGEDSIHINLANATETTVAHEIFHGTLVNVARQNPAAFAAMRDAVVKKLDDSDLLNVYDDNGKLLKLTSKEYLNRFSSQYSPAEQAEEFLSELTALLATDKAKLKDATIWESIKLAIRSLMKTAGVNIPVFEETADINDTVKFFNDLSKSLKTGQEIIPFKLKTKDDKKATKSGASVQTADGESQATKEDESLRNSVSKTIAQRRKGNELGKKKRKLSAIATKAMAIEPTTPDDYALQYFINGGQVIRGSKDDTTEKDTVFSLFSKSRMGGAKESVSEMRARVRIMAGRDAGGLSISEIAEKTFAEYQQATKGDVGIDVDTQYDFMDFKNAVESAILGHKSDTAMANTLLESKNQSTEEGAATLTEEQEIEALRNKAEAQSMGMTEEDFVAKLAELQDAPEMQAAEEAYAQALDMIEDEDFAKLYELNDEDIAKIDELMAGLESTEGALDDKLAEQKKIVRDLESERKKVVSAMEKAGKETQLDITGKAPIQEQLFGADTKSLTDRLQSIETQLATAKADVAATQSAIDFQERGTVDMFESRAGAKPTKLGKGGNDLILQHGSPHNFEQFQLEKIGTGEGAQAFGYGLYFTDGSKIAKGYADKLSKDGTGTVYSVRIKDGRTSSWANWREPIDEAQEQLLFNSLLKEDRAAYDKFVEDAFNNGSNKDYTGAVSDLKIGKDGYPAYERQTASGNLYLDLKDALGQQKATEIFKSAGFNGIKYEAKRGLSDSTNYVVFDPSSIEIISKETATKAEETKPAVEPISESKLIASVKKASKAKQVRIENFGDSFLMLLTFNEGERQIVNTANEARINDTIESLERKVSGLKNRDLVQAQQDLVELAKDSSTPASRLSAKKRQINSIKEQIKDIEQVELPFAKYVSANIQKQPTPASETTKPAKLTKEQKEIKQIEKDLDFYTRQLEDSTEEIRNTNSNYQEEVDKIKAKKEELTSLRLSRDEKSERKEELNAELEEAADERDTILGQYNDSIKEAKAEIKILNKRLAKLQEANPNVKFQKQGIKLAPKSVGEIYNKYPNVVLDIFISDSKKEISLDRIIVPKEDRNKGVGTDIVSDVVRYADANGYRINLTPSGDFGGSKDRLTKFYKGFGFVENKGKNKDFSTKELMYRLPLDKPATEEINAQFTATRDNTPIGFNYDTDLVARERFNIPTLKRIGEGSDRVVFDLGDGNVLKVAKTARGLSQNIYEGSYDLVEEGILPEVLETGLNYIVAEKVESAKGNKAVNELVRDLKNFTQRDFDMRTSKLQDVLEANDLSYVMNYDVLYGDLSAARNWGVKNGKPIHLDGGTFGGVQMIQQYQGVKNLDDNDFREVYYKSRQAKAEFGDKDKFTKFQKTGISTAPVYKYQMNEMFKDPQRLTKDIESKYDISTTLRERGKVEGSMIEVERKLTDNIVLGALSRVGVVGFKTIGAIENAPLFKAGNGKTVKTKQALTGWVGYSGNALRTATLRAVQGNNKFAAETGRVAASLVGNLAKSDILQEQRKLRTGAQLDANNSIAMLAKGLNGMIGFDERALMRVHSLLDPEAFIESEDAVTSPKELSLQELRLYNTLRDMNDFIHEWHYQNGFLDDATYEKHKGKYFARMYEEIERKEFADLSEAIDKMPSGADFRMFKERKDFSEIELTLMNDPIYITSRRLATMLHNKATIEFCDAMANDPSYVKYSKLEDVPENNRKGFRLLESAGGGKRYGELSNKYIPIALYEELRGTTFATKFISKSYDVLRMYDGLEIRQLFKKTKTLYNPTTRLGNITTNFAFAWLAGVDPFTMMKNRVKAKDSLDNYDNWAKELAMAGALGTNVISADLAQRKKGEDSPVMDFLVSKGVKKEIVEKAKTLDKYLVDSYGRTDDVAKISLYRSLVEDYGKSKEEAIRIVGESMQNYATVGKAYQFFSKVPLVGNPFVKFSSDMARIVANGFANRPLYMASFLGMMYGTARLLSALSGEPEDEREARESRAFIPKIPLGFTDIPLTWKVGKYEVNAARFISPYYVYDAGYRSNTVAELTKFAPIQLSYDNKVGFASDYTPVMSDPFLAPLAQVALDRDFRGLPIADPNGSKYTKQTVTGGEALWNRFNYLGHSYASPAWGYIANLYSAAKGEGDLYGRRRDIPSAILNSVIKVQEMESKDVQKAVINQVKYIDSEYKQIKTDITSRRNDDVDKIRDIVGSDATESQKEEQIMNVKVNYSNYVEEMVGRMQELKIDREVPMDRLYKIQHPKKND